MTFLVITSWDPCCPLGPSIDCAGNHVLTALSVSCLVSCYVQTEYSRVKGLGNHVLTALSVSVLFPAMFRLGIVDLKAWGNCEGKLLY